MGERGERRERREGGRKGGRKGGRRKEGQTLFGEEDEERLPIQLQRPEPMAQPAILKNEAPTPAFKIMGGGIDTQRKDQTPLRVTARLLDEELNIYTDELMRHMTEHPDFTVIGVLGFQGTGKSRVLSELCGYRRQATADGRTALVGAFTEQDESEMLEGSHHTVGVEACVNVAEQLILLDVQPLLSASLLVQRMRQRRDAQGADGNRAAESYIGLDPAFTSHENQLEMEGLSLAVWLLSVCHVVLVVAEQVVDIGLIQLLQTALMLQQRLDGPLLLPNPASSNAPAGTRHTAQLNFVLNKCEAELWREEPQRQLQQLLNMFKEQPGGAAGSGAGGSGADVAFDLLPVGSPLGPGEQPHAVSGGGTSGNSGGSGGGGGSGSSGGKNRQSSGSRVCWRGGASGNVSYGVAVKQWREGLLRRLPARGFGAPLSGEVSQAATVATSAGSSGSGTNGSGGTSATVPTSKPMSEREWLRAASRLWTAVRASAATTASADSADQAAQGLGGYNQVLQQMPWQTDAQGRGVGRSESSRNTARAGSKDKTARPQTADGELRPRDRDPRDSEWEMSSGGGSGSGASGGTKSGAAGGRRTNRIVRDPSEFDPRDVRYRPPPADSEKDVDKEKRPKTTVSTRPAATKGKGKSKSKGREQEDNDSVYLEPPPAQRPQQVPDSAADGHHDNRVGLGANHGEDDEDEDPVAQSQEN